MLNFIEELKWNFYMLKLDLKMASIDAKNKHNRRRYCRFGIHKIHPSYVGRGGSGQHMKYVRFIKCAYCNFMFFAKKSDKDRYLKWQKEDELLTTEHISALLKDSSSAKPNSIKGVGESDNRRLFGQNDTCQR